MHLVRGGAVAYIHHRLTHAGATEPIFIPEACAAVHGYSGGVPRIINVLCDTALGYDYAEAVPEIGVDIVQSVIQDRSSGIQSSNARTRNVIPGLNAGRDEGKVNVFDRDMAREIFSSLRKR